jgi:hypothetical protein
LPIFISTALFWKCKGVSKTEIYIKKICKIHNDIFQKLGEELRFRLLVGRGTNVVGNCYVWGGFGCHNRSCVFTNSSFQKLEKNFGIRLYVRSITNCGGGDCYVCNGCHSHN